MVVYAVVSIDHYGGDTNDCWCTFSNYDGVEIYADKELAEARAKAISQNSFASAVVETRTIL